MKLALYIDKAGNLGECPAPDGMAFKVEIPGRNPEVFREELLEYGSPFMSQGKRVMALVRLRVFISDSFGFLLSKPERMEAAGRIIQGKAALAWSYAERSLKDVKPAAPEPPKLVLG